MLVPDSIVVAGNDSESIGPRRKIGVGNVAKGDGAAPALVITFQLIFEVYFCRSRKA